MAEALKTREEQRILLHNASWETYERLLAEREERRSTRGTRCPTSWWRWM